MKILFILENYFPNIGGLETLFTGLTDHLKREGHEIFVLTRKSERHLSSMEVVNGVRIRRLSFRNRFAFTFFSLPWAIYYGRRFDCIHTTSYNAALPAFVAAWLLRKKCFITFHEYWGKLWFRLPYLNYFTSFLFYGYERFISKFSFTKFIAVSESTRQCLIAAGISPGRIIRIYNGIDYTEFSPFEHEPTTNFTVTYFGRIGVSKGVDLFVQASKYFLQRYPDATIKMIVPLKPVRRLNRLKRFITGNNLKENFIFFHELSKQELKRELCNSSCVIIPSYNEGFCFAAAESIAMGIPLISSDKGALKEVVSGTYIKMEDLTVPCLLHALESARANQWTMTPIKHFKLEDCIEQYKHLYTCTK